MIENNFTPTTRTENTEKSAMTIPALLFIPLEIRHQIYKHFLKCDEVHSTKLSETVEGLDFKVLSVCRQMRAEAWEYLCNSNRWILYAYFPLNQVTVSTTLGCTSSFEVPLNLFPRHQILALKSRITLTIRVGQGCGRKNVPTRPPVERKIFAYNPQIWIAVCSSLAIQTGIYRNVSFDLSTKFHESYDQLLPNFLSYLSLVRGVNRARFTKLMDNKFFENMAANMLKPLHHPQAMQEYLKAIKEQGDYLRSKGDIRAAVQLYLHGVHFKDAISGPELFASLSEQFNNIVSFMPQLMGAFHLVNDLAIAGTNSMHALVETSKINGALPPRAFRDIDRSQHFIEQIMVWPGIPDEQRSWIHLARGKVLLHNAEYVQNPENVAYAQSVIKGDISFDKSSTYYQEAANEFFFAKDLDSIVGGPADFYFQHISKKLGGEEGLKPKITVMDIPGYGTWRGDSRWLEKPMMDAESISLCPPVAWCFKEEEELRTLREDLGIEWRDENVGVLRLMVVQ